MKIQEIFRKYDLRGEVGKHFSPDDAYAITQAIVTYFKQVQPDIKNIAVGMDGRTHSEEIKEFVCQAIIDSGLNAHFIGLCPTPALYFACHNLPVEAGIMITASHNPKEDNGFKLVLNCESVWDQGIVEIAKIFEKVERYDNDRLTLLRSTSYEGQVRGNYFEHDLVNQYIEALYQNFKHLENSDLNFVIDCGNGTAGVIIPKLIQKLNWKNVTVLYPEVDGNYPHHNPNPVEHENMLKVEELLKQNPTLQFGVGLDGDCDRFAAMTKSGFLIPGDQLLGLFALHIDKRYSPAVVMDVKCSEAIGRVLKNAQIPYYISPTGHAYIKSYLKEHHATIGGELSGHFCFKDRHVGYDDGIYALLRLCEILVQTKQDLQTLVNIFPATYCSPEVRLHCAEETKNLVVKAAWEACKKWPNTEILALDGIRIQTEIGWAVVRAANTEAAISLRIEGYSAESLQQLKQDLFAILAPHLDAQLLATKLEL